MVHLRHLALSTLSFLLVFSPVIADGQGSFLWNPPYTNEANVYARVIELQHAGPGNGRLLATWEHWYANNTQNAAFPNGTEGSFIIRESVDNGVTWTTLTTIYDTQTGPGHPCARFWQPFFFEFPHQIGEYPEGTLLLVGNLVPNNKSFTEFFTWRSTDQGRTWDPVGAWQEGGTTTAGIWEPFLYLDSQGALVAAFSDERDSAAHSQMLVQVVSHDGGDSWGEVIRTVVSNTQTDRPGMPTVVRMDNGQYLMTYEICGREPLRCPIHVKTSVDGITWNAADLGTAVVSQDGRYAGSSPYTIWDPSTKQLVLAPHNVWDITTNIRAPEAERSIYINKNYGVGAWSWAPSPWAVSFASPACNSNYSPHLLPRSDGVIRYTAPTSQGSTGFCAVRTGQAPIGVLPYRADFTSNQQLGWINTGAAGAATWSVSGDEYRVGTVGSGISALALTGSTGWTDYKIRVDVKIVGNSGVVGVVARVSQPKPGLDQFYGYTLAINSATGNLTLSKNTDNMVVLHSVAYPGGIQADRWYSMLLEVQGPRLTAAVKSGSCGFNLTYTAIDNSHRWGLAGLIGKIGGGSFRNMSVDEI
jgi:hypothetical protein